MSACENIVLLPVAQWNFVGKIDISKLDIS